MSGGAFEIEYVVVKCFGGSYIYICVLCVLEGFIGMLCDIYAGRIRIQSPAADFEE